MIAAAMVGQELRSPQPDAVVREDLGASFHTAMVHLYRAEMHRMTAWRQRLDVTSNWAILLTMGLTTFTLGSPQIPHFILLLGLALIAISIVLEARRYRHLYHSKWRLHVLERGYFAAQLLDRPGAAGERWRAMLAEDLEHPRLLLGWFAATRVRLRRNYLLLIYFVTVVWITKLFVHPESPHYLREFYDRLAVGELVPSWLVVVTAGIFILTSTLLALTCPSMEELESWAASGCGAYPDPFVSF